MKSPDYRRIDAIAEDLRGTAQDLSTACAHQGTDQDDLTREELARLDDTVMLCEQCGWWCESDCMNDDGLCDECAPGDDE